MRKLQLLVGAICVCFAIFWGTGCAHRYYLGFHGPSIRAYPEIHQGAVQDDDCLKCHHPEGDPEGPPTTHPNFKGCLKCHNDEL